MKKQILLLAFIGSLATGLHARRDWFDNDPFGGLFDDASIMNMRQPLFSGPLRPQINMRSHDIREKDGDIKRIYEFEVPGRGKKELDVHVDEANRLITVTFKSRDQKRKHESHEGFESHSYSSSSQSFQQALTPPADADLDSMKASVKHGILTISVKRGNTKDARRQLEIDDSDDEDGDL